MKELNEESGHIAVEEAEKIAREPERRTKDITVLLPEPMVRQVGLEIALNQLILNLSGKYLTELDDESLCADFERRFTQPLKTTNSVNWHESSVLPVTLNRSLVDFFGRYTLYSKIPLSEIAGGLEDFLGEKNILSGLYERVLKVNKAFVDAGGPENNDLVNQFSKLKEMAEKRHKS